MLAELTSDFRVGGRERSRFGPASDPRFWSEGAYLDIVPGERIISAGAMHDDPATIPRPCAPSNSSRTQMALA